MKIQFCAIGKNHEPHFKEAIDVFTARISHYFPVEWKIIASTKATKPEEMKRAESKLLLQNIQQGDFVVALDENGRQMDSVQLADFIEKQSFKSIKNLVFVIGGAFGFDETFLGKCDFKWSLSKLTFPHQLVRLILAEQVYRSCTILRNEKYHHS